MKIYGIKTCGSVKKAMKFMKDSGIDFEFVDFKSSPVDREKINEWLEDVSIDLLFNNKGTKYRTLKLKELNLNEEGKKEWLEKENLLIKRPVIEYNGKTIVTYDEEKYKEIFL